MKNKASDLHNILFEQLERLNDLDSEEMKGTALINENKRAKAICELSMQINNNGRLMFDVLKVMAKLPKNTELPDMFKYTNELALPPPKDKSNK